MTARSSGSGCTNAGPTSRCYLGGGAAAEGELRRLRSEYTLAREGLHLIPAVRAGGPPDIVRIWR